MSSLSVIALIACGTASPDCAVITLTVTPVTATLNHTVAGNSQQYTLNVSVPPGCPLPPLAAPVWSLSSTADASISSNGIASCKSASATPITVSAGHSFPSATLICN